MQNRKNEKNFCYRPKNEKKSLHFQTEWSIMTLAVTLIAMKREVAAEGAIPDGRFSAERMSS